MPIRIDKDPEEKRPNRPNNPNPNDGGGGMGGLMNFVPYILMFLLKKPKLLIPIVVIGGLFYFMAGDGCGGLMGPTDPNNPTVYTDEDGINSAGFAFGATLNQEEYDKAQVFEPLSATYGAPTLPRKVSLRQYAPTRGHQGRQGSCVGWASSYSARTILHARQTGANPNKVAFSPSYLYNQIALSDCQGAYMRNAMETMKGGGVLPLNEYPYDDRSCSSQPTRGEQQQAQQYRIKGYNRLTQGADRYGVNVAGIKQNLAQGAPVVIGMMVGGTFMNGMKGKQLWRPTQRDYQQYGFSGHAMTVIGYDDDAAGGVFEIMNSWGPEWGDNGIGFVKYSDFQQFTKEAYGLYPMGSADAQNKDRLAVKFGLVDNKSGQLIPLYDRGARVFRTTKPIAIGDRFKVAITNSIESYVYVFGKETDGSCYTLFPYTDKHSAYCGIVGTRVFPREESLRADNLGTKDDIAIVVSKDELNHQQINQMINNSQMGSFVGRVRQALQQVEIPEVEFDLVDGGAIAFDTKVKGKNAVAVVIEIDKK